MPEDLLAQAQRHVREGERRVAAQAELVTRMKAYGDSEQAIATGEALLVAMRRTLELMREHLELEHRAGAAHASTRPRLIFRRS